ncbi:MAG: hypothetical protein ACRDYU_04345, partial [Actinomycetes bacterium]
MTLPGPVSVLHVLDRLDDADEQRRVRALAQARYRVIDVCALRPATFAPPPAVGFVEGDGTTRGARVALERALQ